MPETEPDPNAAIAAAIAAAALRFDIERLPTNPMALPYDQPGCLGETGFVVFPDTHLVFSDDLTAHLASLRKPVALAALARKGFVGTGRDRRAVPVSLPPVIRPTASDPSPLLPESSWRHNGNQDPGIGSHMGQVACILVPFHRRAMTILNLSLLFLIGVVTARY
jgi:hypothetical protein